MVDGEEDGNDTEADEATNEEDQEEEVSPEVEERARTMGWVPPEDFKGKGTPRTAQEFIDFGEKSAPILADRLDKANAKIEELGGVITNLTGVVNNVKEESYQRALTEVKAEQRQAVEEGDTKAYDAAEKKLDKLGKAVTKDAVKAGTDAPPPEVREWVGRNQWFDNDAGLRNTAIAYLTDVQTEFPGMSLDDQLNEVGKMIKQAFPRKFGKEAPPVGGGSSPKKGGKKQSVAALPQEARAAGVKFVEQGLYKDMSAYAKVYFEGESA
tara:strand:- start:531 stop:1334 length:804 start_codon:yes stop_codon:yes gene_type:complete